MTTYRVLGTKRNGSDLEFYVSADKDEMQKCFEAKKKGYPDLHQLLVHQNLLHTASKIKLVQQAKPRLDIPKIEFHAKSVAQPEAPSQVSHFQESPLEESPLEESAPVVYQSEKSPHPVTESEALAVHVVREERTAKPVSQSCCRVLTRAACCGIVGLSAIGFFVAALFAGDHHINGGALRERLFEQLGLDELTLQDVQDKFCLAFQGS